jgi:probable rRNA maturation factor
MQKADRKVPVHFHFLKNDFSLVNRNKLKIFINTLFKKEKKSLAQINYIFCSDNFLLKINQDYLQHNFYTDIITFDLSERKNEIIGEIYISIDRVKENAQTFKSTINKELHKVIFHGALHLCGYKDKSIKEIKIMRQKEEEYLLLYCS